MGWESEREGGGGRERERERRQSELHYCNMPTLLKVFAYINYHVASLFTLHVRWCWLNTTTYTNSSLYITRAHMNSKKHIIISKTGAHNEERKEERRSVTRTHIKLKTSRVLLNLARTPRV